MTKRVTEIFKSLSYDAYIALILVVVCIVTVVFANKYTRLNDPNANYVVNVDVTNPSAVARIPEIKNILAHPNTPIVQASFYLKLIKRIGPVAAQEALQRSGLPYNGNSHLINHTVGDYLYETYGNSGLVYCKEYFLASCYHGFTLNIVADEKDKIIKNVRDIVEICNNRTDSLVHQCTHAIGHGVLAYVGYANLKEALDFCDQLHENVPDMPAIDCYDGVFMENIFGVHDGVPSPDRWIKENDLLYPCDDSRIGDKYLDACWRNQVTIIRPMVGHNAQLISELCLNVKQPRYQLICMHGLARMIQLDAQDNTSAMINDCGTINKNWHDYCLQVAGSTAFLYGDHRSLPYLCEATYSMQARQVCRQISYNIVTDLISGYEQQLKVCQEYIKSYKVSCIQYVTANLQKHKQ